MDFIQTSNKSVDKFGAGKHGFSAGVPGTGTLATFLSNLWCDGVQQEFINVIEGAGIVASGASLSQMKLAVKRLAGANVRTITATGPTALTADDAGLIVLDATANAVSITLPACNLVAGVPLEFEFVRIDTTANAVTISRAGADTFVGGATSFTLAGRKDQRVIRSDATSKWATTSTGGNQLVAAIGYREIGGGLILQWGSVAVPSAENTDSTTTFALSFPTGCQSVVITDASTTTNNAVVWASNNLNAANFTSHWARSGLTLGSTTRNAFYLALGY